VTDPLQVRKRRLRYRDPVMVRRYDGSLAQFLVVSCTPSYKKDRVQMATYKLVTQANISERAVIPITVNDLSVLLQAFARVTGADMKQGQPTTVQQQQGQHVNSDVMALPSLSGTSLQNLDPNSPNFGKFNVMAGYSLVGGLDLIG